MIDLTLDRAALLAEIDAPAAPAGPFDDIACVGAAAAVQLRLRGNTRAELFPVLELLFSERFVAVPRAGLIRDLLMPLKHALGNACKHGNNDDPARTVTVDVVLTGSGAVVAVSDEGAGFDVAITVQRLLQQRQYFVHHGSGLRGLHRARSAITWEDGGRTIVLRFRAADRTHEDDTAPGESLAGAPDEAAGAYRDDDAALRRILDPEWVRARLFPSLSNGAGGDVRLESTHALVRSARAGNDRELRFLLRVRTPGAHAARVWILTGRLHADDATAAADYAGATTLNEGRHWKGLRVPAVLRVPGEPRLVLYDFQPWMSLWQYLAYRGTLKALRHSASRVGEALAILHGSAAGVTGEGLTGSPAARLDAAVRSGERALEALPGGTALVQRLRAAVLRVRARAPIAPRRSAAPIHGALGWSCIHYGIDGYFYFNGFQASRRDDVALDAGGFAADLLRFTLLHHDADTYRVCRDDLLNSYNAAAAQPIDVAEIPLYCTLALLARLGAGQPRSAAAAEPLLAALDAVASGA